jgi:hypothetical protein
LLYQLCKQKAEGSGGDHMRKIVLILIAFIAVVTFIRAFDNSAGNIHQNAAPEISGSISLESGN